jgi:transposase InsO family protein
MLNAKQVARLMSEYRRTSNVSMSALKVGIDRKTAGKYVARGGAALEPRVERSWRTRGDPIGSELWDRAVSFLVAAPEVEAKMLFEHLTGEACGGVRESQLRTFQRRVRRWRAEHGPAREVFFAQRHRPGEAMQVDWTRARDLGVRVGDEPLDHLLCQHVLPYSNWQSVSRCMSESMLSLRFGTQEALWQLGRVPAWLQIDNSSAATHRVGEGQERGLNAQFEALAAHYGMKVRTIRVGCPNENGDVESLNGHVKRRIEQHLLLRGSRRFDSEMDYDRFLLDVTTRANRLRTAKVAEELAAMRELPPTRLGDFDETQCRVSSQSTIRVKGAAYSVPARLVGESVRVRIYEGWVEVSHGGRTLERMTRRAAGQTAIDYRHVIQALLRKPGAFARYRHREELFPHPTLRAGYDRLVADHGLRTGELEYLRVLKLAADVGQEAVQERLEARLRGPAGPWRAQSLELSAARAVEVSAPAVDLSAYDALLAGEAFHGA